MRETYLDITKQIEKLKQKAEAVREQEIAGVVDRIRSAIAAYGLTHAQLFDAMEKGGRRGGVMAQSGAAKGSRGTVGPRFRDTEGHSWSGRGPRPGWLKAALDAGKSLDEFKVPDSDSDAAGPAPKRRRARTGAAKAAMAVKYRDDAGHAWSGRGPRPGWFKAAIESGKTAEEMSV